MITANALAQQARRPEDPYTLKAISIGPEFSMPAKTDFKYGVGASGQVEYPFTDLVSFTGSIAYTRYYYKVSSNEFGAVGPSIVIPVKVGAKFFLDPDIHCDIETGVALETNYTKRKSFAVSFLIGYTIPLEKNPGGVDIGLKFEDWGKERMRAVGLRVAYRLGWK